MIEELELLLDFSPILIASFAGLSFITIQMLKHSMKWVERHAMVLNWVFSLGFATLVVLEQFTALSIALVAFLIMTSASGIYGSVKKETNITIGDYTE